MECKALLLIDDLKNRFDSLRSGKGINLRLQLFDIVLGLNSAKTYFINLGKQMKDSASFEALTVDDCIELQDKISSMRINDSIQELPYDYEDDYCKHIIDYVFPGGELDENGVAVDRVRTIIDSFMSDNIIKISSLKRAVTIICSDITRQIEYLKQLSQKKPSNDNYVELEKRLYNKYSWKNDAFDPAYKYYREWKDDVLDQDDENEYNALIREELMKLLNSGFIIIDEAHLPNTYKTCTKDMDNILSTESVADDIKKKLYILKQIVGFENGRFLFRKNDYLGKYIFKSRKLISEKHMKAFYRFRKICILVYKEFDKEEVTDEKQTVITDITDDFTAFTWKIDDVTITKRKLRDFLLYIHKNVKFIKKEGLVLYDVMIIHGLTDVTINKKTFVEDINRLAGIEMLSYNNCKNFDDLEFHKPLCEWHLNEITTDYYKDLGNFNNRQTLARSIETHLLDLKKN